MTESTLAKHDINMIVFIFILRIYIMFLMSLMKIASNVSILLTGLFVNILYYRHDLGMGFNKIEQIILV